MIAAGTILVGAASLAFVSVVGLLDRRLFVRRPPAHHDSTAISIAA